MKKKMERIRRIWIPLLTATVLIFGTCVTAGATESSSDVEPATAGNIDLTKEGYIEIRPKYNGTYLTDGTFAIYRVANVGFEDGNMTYVITEEFAGSGMGDRITREALTDDEEILKDAELINALTDYALENGIAPARTDEVTEESKGWIRFRDVTAGLYLVVQTVDSTGFETADPFLVTYPMVGSDGAWDYYVDVTTKMDLIPVPEEEEYTEISVTKAWNDDNDADGIRPDTIRVSLIADGLETDQVAVLSGENNWTYTFTDLPVLDEYGRDIAYTVEETEVPEGYTDRLTGDVLNGYVITNTHGVEINDYTEVPVMKVWDDGDDADGIRPVTIMVNLLADGEETGQTAVLSDENNWSFTFVNLPLCDEDGREIAYSVDETYVPEGYMESLTGDAINGFVITNTYEGEIPESEYIDIPVAKVWDDNDNEKEKRPDSVTVMLLADGEETGLMAELSETNDWKFTFSNLDICSEEGDEIAYTVAEVDIPEGYTPEVSEDEDGNGFVITNSYENESGGSTGGSGGTSSTKLPQTGQLNWPIPLLAVGGIFFFILGWAFNRPVRREKSGK